MTDLFIGKLDEIPQKFWEMYDKDREKLIAFIEIFTSLVSIHMIKEKSDSLIKQNEDNIQKVIDKYNERLKLQ